ncbi:DNA mismatch repair endonuclease MutL [Brevibacillus sp. SYP-B805]|uniref:DNA mismatch repair endonuclease MutL n=1 Tax=Brevibacillus sp. SYP-B805 TaxID=1578199 RepID=UPI0013E9A930|nr:DNA mismatch repair endonuclease MutL [Brevibacillus sp. SYP-B805]NGQ96371.1 DNA mismatch repair endonuclease MutL [Brevibacillus sp. SYP-B805]
MGKIQVLDEQLSNMIAAGEVVERPASVVKELLENAIDAGARKIEIEVEEGGLQLIRVVDDGEGMDRDDCLKAFERHATSKIRTPRDLFAIRSLGFRGEALPSIASVSRVEVISTLDSGQIGTRLIVEGGQVKSVADAARVKGTEVCVRDLFYNTPARLKYMKSIATEIGHISDYVNRLALTYPQIAFTLTHNGKELLHTSGDGKLLHVIAAIYGVQTARMMLPIEGESLDFTWRGFLARTEVTRANRSYLSTLVNGRYIRHFGLHNAIMRGYHTLLPVGRYPIVVLQIDMDPTLVDVNVHPAKLEVRFSKEEELCAAIEQSVRDTLRQGLSIVQPLQAERGRDRTKPSAVQAAIDFSMPKPAAFEWDKAGKREGMTPAPPVLPAKLEEPQVISKGMQEMPAVRDQAEAYGAKELKEASPFPPSFQTDAEPEVLPPLQPDAAGREEPAVPIFYPVGQVHGTYIVAQNDTGMYLIDQHAAQERIYYEYFMEKLRGENAASQILLFPHTVECTVAEAERLQNRLELLRSFGLEIEWFGNRTFIVRAHPHWFPEGCELEVIEELIQFVLESGETGEVDLAKMREKAAIMMSCKAAIKANQYLTQAEMESLLNRLRETTSPFTCPHGRPIIIHFSTYDLEKMFKRVM